MPPQPPSPLPCRNDSDEGLLDRAADIVIGEQRGSVSLLQRKLEVGFSRAGELMDALERAGIVGPQLDARARKVMVTLGAWRARRHVPEGSGRRERGLAESPRTTDHRTG